MKSLLVLLVALLAAFSCIATLSRADKDVTIETNGIAIDFVGQSPKFKWYSPDDNETFYMISFQDLTEVDGKGVKTNNKVTGLASQDLSFVGPVQSSAGVLNVNFTGTVSVGHGNSQSMVTVDIAAYLYSDNATVQNGNETIHVPKDSIKFTIAVADWPFESMDHRLAVSIRLGGSASEVTQTNGSRFVFGSEDDETSAFIDFAQTAVVDDNENEKVTVSIDKSGSNTDIVISLPYFTDAVVYDPVMGLVSNHEDNASSSIPSSAAKGFAVQLAIATIVAFISSFVIFRL